MEEKRNPESFDGHSNETQDASSENELQLPLSCMDNLLEEEQYVPCLATAGTDFLLAVLDCLTDYILEVVGSEASNDTMNINSQDGEGEVDNDEAHQDLKDVPFSLFDEMSSARKTS